MGNRTGIEHLGAFDGDQWKFFEPYTMPGGQVVEVIDFSIMDLPPGLTREEVVEALTDPEAIVDDEGDGLKSTPFTPRPHPERN
jgi:hypothetical protein